jgi:hypothetical protein
MACFTGGGCDPAGLLCGDSPPCNDPSLTIPVITYPHFGPDSGCSITGGYVYRGCRMPNFRGTYFYCDLCFGGVRTFRMVDGVLTDPQIRSTFPDALTAVSFGVDAQGELYVVQFNSVWKLLPPFAELEVSGPGTAEALRLAKAADWTWEDLLVTNDITPRFYSVYRGTPRGAYSCVFRTTLPRWPSGGDPAAPVSGQLFTYVVTAMQELYSFETKAGTTGTFDASTCP